MLMLLKNHAVIIKKLFPLFIVFSFFLTIAKAHADIKLATIFDNSMVLQRGLPINIWGTAVKDENIHITLNGKIYSGQADENGRWLIVLPAQKTATEQSIHIQGNNTIVLNDIAFGDVFLAGGQSNMQFKLKEALTRFPQEIELEQYPDVRHFTVQRHYNFKVPQSDIEGGQWLTASKNTVENFSAVAWFFAKDLYKKHQVPIGIISSNVGATPVETWLSVESLKDFPDTQAFAYSLANDKYITQLKKKYAQERSDWRQSNNEPTKKLPFLLMHRTSLDFKPVGSYNAMIAPLANLKFSGVIWYQGESNTRDPARYSEKFSTMITLWRNLFNQPQLPFMFVQLANFMKPDEQPSESAWAEVRNEQTKVLNSVENTAMALAIDVGERHNIHPLDKKTVGERLALGARHLVYKENQLNYTSPLVDKALLSKGKAIISFTHINKGLVVNGDKLMGFAIAGEDKKYIWAKASLANNKVTVWHNSIKLPKYVRYAWANNPEKANLFNDQGLPATPFSIELQ